MPPTEYHPPELPPDLFVMPVGPGHGGSVNSSDISAMKRTSDAGGDVGFSITYVA